MLTSIQEEAQPLLTTVGLCFSKKMTNVLPPLQGVGSPIIIPNPPTVKVPYHRLQPFVWLRYWSLDDCIALLCRYLTCERDYRQGWNNNVSLTNYDVSSADQEITWSLMLYKLKYFEVCYALIIPFKFHSDTRGIVRAYTTFSLMKKYTVVYCRTTQEVITGTPRAPVIDGLLQRVRSSFGWQDNFKENKQRVYRYRLLTVLDSPQTITLTPDIHVHHKDGMDKILSGNFTDLNDRICNLEALPCDTHRQVHQQQLDLDWKDMKS